MEPLTTITKMRNDVSERYVESAVDALLAGTEIAVTETKAIGCGIKDKLYKKKGQKVKSVTRNIESCKLSQLWGDQPMIRKPKNWRQFFWGGNTCAKCGTEMDALGNEIKPKKKK